MSRRNGHVKIESNTAHELKDIKDLPPGVLPESVRAAMMEKSGLTVEQRAQRFNELLVAAQNETGMVLAIMHDQPAPGYITAKIQAVPRENIRG